jgi:phosphatidylglycerol:prolipoprotein diacylglycerol transferase
MTVYPFAIELGPVTITGYGLMMMVAFLMAGWAIQLELRRRGLHEEYAADIVMAAVVGGLVGGRLWYVAVTGHWDALFGRGGLVWYGGFFGGMLAVLANGWRKRVPLRFTLELAAPALALGYALGRVGCFLVNDDYGTPSSLPWAIRFPQGLPPSTVGALSEAGVALPAGLDPLQVVAVHPTQIYETVVMLGAFAWLWSRRGHGHAAGWLFAAWLTIAGLERFLIEFLRAKDDRFFGPITLAQVTSVALVLAGAWLLRRWSDPASGPEPDLTVLRHRPEGGAAARP